MTEKTRFSLGAIEAALLVGALGDALLRGGALGVNFVLWTCALVAACLALRVRRASLDLESGANVSRETSARAFLFLPACAILFAGLAAWRDSATLQTLDVLAWAMLFALFLWRESTGARLCFSGVAEYARGVLFAYGSALFGGVPLLLNDVRWNEIPRAGFLRHSAAVLRGLLVAVPFALIFGALFVAAEATYERIVTQVFQINIEAFIGHVAFAAILAWLAGGVLRGALRVSDLSAKSDAASVFAESATPRNGAPLTDIYSMREAPQPFVSVTDDAHASLKNETENANEKRSSSDTATTQSDSAKRKGDEINPDSSTSTPHGFIETCLTLFLLDALFGSFVLVQLRYLFGGAAWIGETAGATYAEYARRGFFELVAVAALALPLLLAAHWFVARTRLDASRRSVFKILAGALLALVLVVMLSALQRTNLYRREYGLTELRFYTTAFMIWLGAVCVWFTLTVLRERRERFTCGALAAGLASIALLHFINPDALIVRANFSQTRAGREFDAAYAASLSADAAPRLIEIAPRLNRNGQCVIQARLRAELASQAALDWRAWSVARQRARRAINASAQRFSCAP